MNKWMKYLPVLMLVSLVSLEASKSGCPTVERGPPGPGGATGPTGVAGPTGMTGSAGGSAHCFAFSTISETVTPNGGAVTFPSGALSSGTAITQSASDTFTINATGDYFINYVCYYFIPPDSAALSTPGFQCQLNGTTLVGTNAPAYLPSSLESGNPKSVTGVLSEIINISSVPATLQVVNIDTSNNLLLGFENASATIDIVQLTTP